jgi:DnaA family protein
MRWKRWKADVVALDGLDAIAGIATTKWRCSTSTTVPRCRRGLLLYLAPRAGGLPLALPDLRSRLSQCTRIVP